MYLAWRTDYDREEAFFLTTRGLKQVSDNVKDFLDKASRFISLHDFLSMLKLYLL